MLQQTLFSNRWYFFPLIAFYIFAYYRIGVYSKVENHLFFNQLVGNKGVDVFFKYLTYLGDGLFVIFVILIWMFKNIRQAVLLCVSYMMAGSLVSVLKNYVFDVPRPSFVFHYYYKHIHVKYVEGVEVLAINSFPSGHSTTAFVLFTFLALNSTSHFVKFLMAFSALLVAFSRVYLSQHWINDITAGSLLGLVITLLIYILSEYLNWFRKIDDSLLNLLSKK